ncbi:MAG: MATE family efflux transporter [Bacteroidales bacterium]|jgi:MATE family multidrug resistance protein|nr:MATE family efflux transporter [Bacteroidales bacterium]
MKINREILRLALPNIVSGITVPLLGAVSLAMMGYLDSLVYIGALSIGSMIFNFLYWGFGFLRMGTTGFTAQAFGRMSSLETVQILARGLLIGLTIAFTILLLQKPILHLAVVLIHPSAELTEAVSSYFLIRVWAAPTVLCFFVVSGWLIGMQDTKTLMWISILINVLNVIFNYLFIFVFDIRNTNGAAIGTVCAQYCGFVITVSVLQIKYRVISQLFSRVVLRAVSDMRALRRFLSVNTDIFIRTLCFIFVFAFFTAESAHYGEQILVMNTLLYQFYIFFSYACDGFAHAAEALSGRFTGSGENADKRRSIGYSFLWGAGITLLFLFTYAIGYNEILSMFTSDSGVLNLADSYYWWILFVTLVGMPAFLWDGVFAGSLQTRPLVYTMLFATVGFFGTYYLLQNQLGNNALWLALTVFLIVRGLCLTLWSGKVIPKHL